MLNSKHLHEKDAFKQKSHVSEEVVNQSEACQRKAYEGMAKTTGNPCKFKLNSMSA